MVYASEKGDGDEECGRMHGVCIGERLVGFVSDESSCFEAQKLIPSNRQRCSSVLHIYMRILHAPTIAILRTTLHSELNIEQPGHQRPKIASS